MENQRRDPELQRTPTCLQAPRISPALSPAPSQTTRPWSSCVTSREGGSSPTRRRSTSGSPCPQTWKYQKISFPDRLSPPPWRGHSRGKCPRLKWFVLKVFYHHWMPHSTFDIFPWELCDEISYIFKLSTALITFWMIIMFRKEFLEQHPELKRIFLYSSIIIDKTGVPISRIWLISFHIY